MEGLELPVAEVSPYLLGLFELPCFQLADIKRYERQQHTSVSYPSTLLDTVGVICLSQHPQCGVAPQSKRELSMGTDDRIVLPHLQRDPSIHSKGGDSGANCHDWL